MIMTTQNDSRQRADAAQRTLSASLHGGAKVHADCQLILPPSDPTADPWGHMCDGLAAGTARTSSILKMDVNETALFATSLKYVIKEFATTYYTPTPVRGWGIPVDSSFPAGAHTIAQRRIQQYGRMRRVSPQGEDLSRVDLDAVETTWPVAEYGDYASWTLSELEAAALGNFPLSTQQLMVLSSTAEQQFDQMAATGDAAVGIFGMLNDANIDLVPAAVGTWTGATADEVYTDVVTGLEHQRGVTQGRFVPNLVVCPQNRWPFLNLRRDNTDTNVRQMLEADYPGLRFVDWTRSNLADAAGTGPRLLFVHTSVECGRLVETLPFSPLAPQQEGFTFKVYARAKFGGFMGTHPKGYAHMDGI